MKAANKSNLINWVLSIAVTVFLGYAISKNLNKPQVFFSMDTEKPLYMVDAYGVKTTITKPYQVPTTYEKVWVNK